MENGRGIMEDGLDESVVLSLQPGIVCHPERDEGFLMMEDVKGKMVLTSP